MAQFYVGNVNFESTGNTQLVYSANTVKIRLDGSEIFSISSSGAALSNLSISLPQKLQYITGSNTYITVNNSFTVTGAVIYAGGEITPTTISANTADWNPGVSGALHIRVSANSSVVNSEYMITGMTAGTNGQIITLHNIGPTGIWIRNEESGSNGAIFPGVNTPGSTAANRFNLPNHFKLQGYQAATFYYDGILARWKLTDSVTIPFDHKEWLTKGFSSGGVIGVPAAAYSTTTDRTTYSTEITAAVPGAALSQARGYMYAAGNACKAFISGGANATIQIVTSERVNYVTEATALVTGTNLTQARAGSAAAGNACKGFFSGGANATIYVVTSDKTTYATETTFAVPGSNLSQAKAYAGAAGNACKGFFSGGALPAAPSISATSERTTYSNEIIAAVTGANLTQGRYGSGVAGNACKGFFNGGQTPTHVTTSDRTTYATETTAAVPGANLSQARSGAAAAGNSCKGFFNGGRTACVPTVPAITYSATSDRTTYSTETTAAVPGANLSQSRGYAAGV